MNPAKKAAHRFVAEIREDELVVRVAEAACSIRRPLGKSAAECIAEFKASDAETTAGFRRVARAAIQYFAECVKNGATPS